MLNCIVYKLDRQGVVEEEICEFIFLNSLFRIRMDPDPAY